MDKLNYLLRNIDVAKTKITTLEYQVAKKADVDHVQTINQCLNEDYATREEIFNKINELKDVQGIFDSTQYYTKYEINSNLNNLNNKIDKNYYTKTQIDLSLNNLNNKIDNKTVDLSDYYTKTQIDSSLNNLNNKIDNKTVDLSDYYTKTQIDSSLNNLNTKIDNKTVDLSDYYTKTQIDSSLNNLNTKIDKNYYTKTQIDSSLSNLMNEIETIKNILHNHYLALSYLYVKHGMVDDNISDGYKITPV